MKRLFTLFFILLTVNGLWAQPNTLWTKTFGGSNTDFGLTCDLESFSQSLSETPFSSKGPVEMMGESAAAIDNNSVVIAYTSTVGGIRIGEFIVIDLFGNIELQPVTFHNDITSSPSVAVLDSNSVFICYRDGNDDNKGKYVVYNLNTGEQELSETGFNEGSTGNKYFSTIINNFLVFFI